MQLNMLDSITILSKKCLYVSFILFQGFVSILKVTHQWLIIMSEELRIFFSNISRDLFLKTYTFLRNIQIYLVLYPLLDHVEAVLMTNTVNIVGRVLFVTVENSCLSVE
jgi:hypothetical protein